MWNGKEIEVKNHLESELIKLANLTDNQVPAKIAWKLNYRSIGMILFNDQSDLEL